MNNTDKTLEYYGTHANAFAENTYSLSMNDLHSRFTGYLRPGARIIDFGCGSGRDTVFFMEHGFAVDALDGSSELCRIASAHTGLEIRHMKFEDFSDVNKYDGIWACASILHLPRPALKEVLRALSNALKTDGILYASFKYGVFEGERNGRHFTDMTPGTFEILRSEAVSDLLVTREQWITEDVRPDRKEKWLNIILSRI